MSGWIPARPERAEPGWRPGAQSPASPQPEPPTEPELSGEQQDPALPRPRRTLFRNLTPATRVLAAFAALIVLITGIAGLGAAVTPRYGAMTPLDSTPIADIRSAPAPTGWSVDLAREALPGVPVRCASFQPSSPTTRLVVLTASSPPLGSTSRCSGQTAAQITSTVVLFDPAEGRVLWSADLGRQFGGTSGSVTLIQETVMEEASRVLVLLSDDGDSIVATLSLTTGKVVESRRLGYGQILGQAKVQGTLAFFGASTRLQGANSWTLVDARHLGRTLWTGSLRESQSPILLRGAAFVTVDRFSRRIDGVTGEVTRLGDGTVPLGSGPSDATHYYGVRVVTSGVAITAWSESGRALWTRGGFGDVSGLSRGCVFATLPGTTTITCIDRDTGEMRWTKDLASEGYPASMPGQTNDDVVVMRSLGGVSKTTILDGGTGRTKFELEVVPQTQVIAASRTTGYLQSSTLTGTPTAITAFDTETGQVLWRRSDLDDGDTELWGGHLVTVDSKGIARELVDSTPAVLGAGD